MYVYVVKENLTQQAGLPMGLSTVVYASCLLKENKRKRKGKK